MEFSDHPLPTPPSNPPDTFDRIASPRQAEDPLAASPVLSHPAVIDAFTSDVRDEPPSPATQSSSHHQPNHSNSDIPHADTSIDFARPLSEHSGPADAMDDDGELTSAGLVNGHHDNGDYAMKDAVSGQPTNEPTPPPTDQPGAPARTLTAPSLVSGGVQQIPDVRAHPSQPQSHTSTSNQPPPSTTSNNTDIVMKDASPFKSTPKPVREPPSYEQPPAKRFKSDPSPTYDTSKKIPQNQQKFLIALLRQVKKPKDALPFLQPVDPVKLNIPRYFDVVERPMDLSTIEKKLISGAYPVVQALVDDFNLMIENCVKFNGPDNPVTKMGRNIQAIFEKGIKTLPPETVFRISRSNLILGATSSQTRSACRTSSCSLFCATETESSRSGTDSAGVRCLPSDSKRKSQRRWTTETGNQASPRARYSHGQASS